MRGLAANIALNRKRQNGPGIGNGGTSAPGNNGGGNRNNAGAGNGNRNQGGNGGDPYGNGRDDGNQGGNGQGGKKGGFHPGKILKGLGSNEILSPEQLMAAARALAVLETKPEIHGYQRLATELGNEKGLEQKGLENLGARTTGQVSSVYQNIANSAAQSLATEQALGSSLSGQSADIAKQGTQDLAAMQEGSLGNLTQQLQMRGADGTAGTAQSQLASAVAAQQAQQAASNTSAQQAATQQSGNYAGLLAAQAGSAQAQGGETIGRIGRTIGSRVIKSNKEYGESIKTALQKKAEAKASQGEKMVQNELGLREGDQKFILGKDAVRGKKEELGLAEKEGEREAAEGKTQTEIELAKLHNETRNSLATWKNAQTKKWEAEHPNAGENKVKEKEHELTHSSNEVLSLLHQAVTAEGSFPSTQKELAELIVWVNGKAGADPQVVSKVAKTWWNKHFKAAGQDPNGNSLGR